jgi:hypothetical protein
MLKLAIVKSTEYQDLWVSDITSDPFHVFKTSMMRCSPIGLCEKFQTDFIIIKESNESPSKELKSILITKTPENLQYKKKNKNSELPFLDETYHDSVSLDEIGYTEDEINWGQYNIVITINPILSSKLIEKYKKILWCYYLSENEEYLMNIKIGNYDILLNQDILRDGLPDFSIGFPYTYLGPFTLERIVQQSIGTQANKKGIYMEINNTTERPVKIIPNEFNQISLETKLPIIVHQQNIIENIKGLYGAKYYLKLLGRIIRGNSILESISLGTLVLANPYLVQYNALITEDCYVLSVEDAIKKIKWLEENQNEYNRLIDLQRRLLNYFYFEKPTEQLIEKYNKK